MRSTRRRYASIITLGFEDFMDRMISLYPCDSAIRRNSSALSTIPRGVSPYRFMIRSLSEPWFVPMRMDRPSSFDRLTRGENASWRRCSSRS
jgi:hypothetical protein